MGARAFVSRIGSAVLAGLIAGHAATAAPELPDPAAPAGPAANLRLRNGIVIGVGVAGIAAYGMHKWWADGFGGGFKTHNEYWFGRDTDYGGADKLGHVYANHVGVRVLTPLFESLGNEPGASVSLAAWSTFLAYAGVEVVDAFSLRWRFSVEDLIANAAGAWFGYTLETNPALDALLDLRMDYRRSPYANTWDPLGDYSGQRYLLVLKADGVPALRANPWTRYLEAAFGYGTTGYDAPPALGAPRQRDLYFGLSLNLSRVLADTFYGGRYGTTAAQRVAEHTFELVQFPTIGYVRRPLD